MKITQKQFDKALENLKEVSLSGSVKEQIKQSIMSPEPVASVKVISPYQSLLAKGKKTIVGASIVFVGLSGVAYGTTNSLPNDLLYPIKTEVVEPLVGLTKISVESKQEYQIELAKERIDELVGLTLEGELDAQTQEQIEKDFEEHIAKAESYPTDDESSDEIQQTVELYVSVTSSEPEIPEARDEIGIDIHEQGDKKEDQGDTINQENLQTEPQVVESALEVTSETLNDTDNTTQPTEHNNLDAVEIEVHEIQKEITPRVQTETKVDVNINLGL